MAVSTISYLLFNLSLTFRAAAPAAYVSLEIFSKYQARYAYFICLTEFACIYSSVLLLEDCSTIQARPGFKLSWHHRS